jgi:hypothetical protein
MPLSKFEWVTWVTGRENEWVNGGRDVRRSEPLMRSLSQIRLRAWGRRSRAAHAPEPVRRRGLPRLGAGLGVGHRWPRTLKCSKNVQILTHSKFKRALKIVFARSHGPGCLSSSMDIIYCGMHIVFPALDFCTSRPCSQKRIAYAKCRNCGGGGDAQADQFR